MNLDIELFDGWCMLEIQPAAADVKTEGGLVLPESAARKLEQKPGLLIIRICAEDDGVVSERNPKGLKLGERTMLVNKGEGDTAEFNYQKGRYVMCKLTSLIGRIKGVSEERIVKVPELRIVGPGDA